MITFEYNLELVEGFGYRPAGEEKEQTEVILQIKAKNRVTADRMLRAIIDNPVIANISGVALS